MSAAPVARHPGARRRWLMRSRSDRVLLGVSGGLGRRLGIDPLLIRLGFGVLVAAGGVGIALYVVAWAMSTDPASEGEPAARPRLSRVRQIGATGCIVVGLLLISRDIGLWFGDAVVWPVALAAGGSALIWGRDEEREGPRWTWLGERLSGGGTASLLAGRGAALRVGAGALLVAAGIATFLEVHRAANATQAAGLGAAAAAVGLGLILGPWIVRLTRTASEERRQRVRSEERAEIAAHLHDSVLHTLALIQRSEAPAEMTALARRQERELRAWLGGRPEIGAETDLRGAVDALASRVEEHHAITVDTVVVGEASVDERVRALLLACQEACTNAARHSGASRVSLYLEADEEAVSAFVRDEGRGFDPRTVPDDRRGIAESIMGRMRRHGGTASVVSTPERGTEVQLRLPRARP